MVVLEFLLAARTGLVEIPEFGLSKKEKWRRVYWRRKLSLAFAIGACFLFMTAQKSGSSSSSTQLQDSDRKSVV